MEGSSLFAASSSQGSCSIRMQNIPWSAHPVKTGTFLKPDDVHHFFTFFC